MATKKNKNQAGLSGLDNTGQGATNNPDNITNETQEQIPAEDSYIAKLYGQLSDVNKKVVDAQKAYETAYGNVGTEIGAVADLLKPKDREPERKRIRNVALGQSLGQALSAIFGGIYANSKKGYGKVVMPEDFASKTLSRAEELREKGLLEDKEYKRLMSDMNLRKADLGFKKASSDLSTAQAERQRIEGLIADYNQQQRDAQEKEKDRLAKKQENETTLTWKAEQNDKDRSNALEVAKLRAAASTSHNAKKSFNIDALSDDDILMMNDFLPKEATRTEIHTDETGMERKKDITYPKETWTDKEYSSAWNQAKAVKIRLGDYYERISEILPDTRYNWKEVDDALKRYTPEQIFELLKSEQYE